MTRLSAGIALVRRRADRWELLLVHPGGPYWAGKDEYAWSIPKGEVDGDEVGAGDGDDGTGPAVLETTARREFTEETGQPVPPGPMHALPVLRVGSGKRLQAFVVEGEIDADRIVSNEIEIEWPPRSGRRARVPEVDRAAWYDLDEARTRLHKGQAGLVDLVRVVLDGVADRADGSGD